VGDRLDGARLKLERAEEHRQTLIGEFQQYWSSDAYVPEPDVQDGEAILRAKVRTPPDPMWSVIIGEWAHNVRCALDYITWELGVDYKGPAPNPIPPGSAGRPWRDVQFPIVTSGRPTPRIPAKMLALIDPNHWARF
jgi:hypothetical protein